MNFLKNILTKLYRREDDSHEFKPILAEIEDNPLNPLGTGMFWIVISFMFIAAAWLYFAKVDVVVTAQGIVIPAGEEKLVQSLEKGVVRELNVKEGDIVKRGQILAIITPAEYEPGLELNNLKEEENILRVQISAASAKLKFAQEKKNRLQKVLDLIPRTEYDSALEEISFQQHEISRYSTSLAEIRNKREQIEKQRQVLTSPIDGYVGQIFVHTVGGVVTPAEKIMSVVPQDAKLQIRAKVLNQDIGFVEKDMPVSVKIDTYNFQKYGIIDGVVTVVSPNSIQDDRLGYVYDIYISPINKTLLVEGKEENLRVGMTTTNEIKIGKRRVIEFFIYPLIKYMDESIKVR